MKAKIKNLILMLLASSLISHAFAQNNQKLYKAKSGIIEYEMTGKTTGKQTMYFDNHGINVAEYTESSTKVLGMKSSENTLSLRLDSIFYEIDLEEKKGYRTILPFYPSQLTEEELNELVETGQQLMDEMGFEKTGEEKILNRNCEIWEGMGTKVWIWEGLTLKTEFNLMGHWVTEAVRIEINPKISKDKFKVPEGIEISNQDLDFDYNGEEVDIDDDDIDVLDSVATDVGKELEKGLNELRSILGVKKKKK